ncbi:hypothetical protein JOE11_001252 [Robbsia andropogonis]|uniref:hypothetical protein n=1 Tax=Robbsia andropogonis TaxID=28092 RepID=UPI003D1F2D5E
MIIKSQSKKRTSVSSLRKFASGLAVTLLLAACAAPLPKNAGMVHKEQTVVIVTPSPSKPGFYRVGQQGLLDIAINHAVTASVASWVESLEAPPLDRARDNAAEILRTNGYKVSVEPNTIDLAKLPKFDGSQAHRTRGDWREWGAARPYYGFIPTGKSYPVGDIVAEVIDPNTNTEVSLDKTSVPAQPVSDWDRPPSYAALTAEITQQFERSLQAFSTVIQRDFPGFGASDGLATNVTKVTANASTVK